DVAALLLRDGSKGLALANATGFLDGFGHFVVAWIWLALARAADAHPDPSFAEEKRWTCRYFYAAEVPRIRSMMALLLSAPRLVAELPDHVVSA
ncbi:MAG TPA: acyl-CoA dehydrogenase C-terminal domain-containing protein, partial [Paracoccus solventivorans]|uniref:acyl-CoA dehydrogenase C-terminal domain-containing protein n=1 Tax=Paracoccus solventivorans TaxID=53463 RepID=UPI002BBC01E6